MGMHKKIKSLESFFRRVSFPLQPLHYETGIVLDALFEKGVFLGICDATFGSFTYSTKEEGSTDISWMDVANTQPNGDVAMALFRLLAPGGHLCNLLEAVSLPQHDFTIKLKRSWKGDIEEEGKFNPFLRYFDFPLSDLYSSFHELLQESAETNLFEVPRFRCPPLLLVPFWMPPLVTRLEPSSRRVLTSLRCSPLPYFILRMLLYVTRCSEKNSNDMVRQPRAVSLKEKIKASYSSLVRIISGSSTELPLYHRLLTAYIQYFVSSSYIQRHCSKLLVENIQWSVSDVAAALLLSAPSHLWLRNVQKPELERHRTSCRDVASASVVFRLIPFLTECLIALYQKDQGKTRINFWEANPAIGKEFYDDHSAPTAFDILNPYGSFYRNILSVLRQSLVSLENFSDCRREHFNNTLELWYTVMNPTGDVDDVSESYVVRHYEAYSFIMIDVIYMILRSTFLDGVDMAGASMWARCVEIFTLASVQNVFSEVNNTLANEKSTVVNAICRFFVLNWTDDDGMVHMMTPFSDKMLFVVMEIYLAVEQRLEEGGLDKTACNFLRSSLDSLTRSFEGVASLVEKCRTSRVSTKRSETNTRPDTSHKEEVIENARERKDFYFCGIQRSFTFSGPINARFDTENVATFAQTQRASDVRFSDEFPFLIGLTEWLDTVIGYICDFYYFSWIPQCSKGHNLWLLSCNVHTCMNHHHQQAVWECFVCEEVYGSCCRSGPRGHEGKPLIRVEVKHPASYCSQCFVLLEKNSVAYMLPGSEVLLCTNCSSRPFKKVSCRFLASHVCAVPVAVVLFFVICFFLSLFF